MSADHLDLQQFIGTCHYYQWSVTFKNCLLTDGTKYLADEAKCYWLMDVIASHLPSYKDFFGVARLVRNEDRSFTFTLDDGNGHIHATQKIEYSDFPMDSITIYVVNDTQHWTLMLQTEY